MAECIECGNYTKYDGGLCFNCYKKKKPPKKIAEAPAQNENNGLNEKERNYRYNMIKGRIAETLIQELFLSLGYNVFRYGMENTIPGIMELLKGVRSDVAQEIRRMPDFVIQDPRSKSVYFAEIKFRAKELFKFSDLPKNYPYENAYIILVSKKHIKCITVEELKEGKEISPTSKNYLGSRKEFGLQKNVIIDFCDFAVLFFKNV
jgi:hypothetical protein